jgi:alanine racemase-like protein
MPTHWLELDRASLRQNLTALRTLVGPRRVMPVVKANCYGASAVPIAQALVAEGVDALAVAKVSRSGEDEITAHEIANVVGSLYRLVAAVPADVPRVWAST